MDHFRLDVLDPKPEASPKPSPKSEVGFVITRIELLMGSYRKTDYQNPEAFIATLVAILEEYPPEIVEYVTDPKTGLQRRLKFPPTSAEVVEACAAEIAWRTKVAQNSSLSPVPRLPRPRFRVEDSYEEMFKKYGRPTGPFERPGDDWGRKYPPKSEATE